MALDKLTQITSSGINSTTPLNGISVTGIVTGGASTFDSVTIPDISAGPSPSTEIKIWPGNKSYSSETNSIAIGGTGTLMLNTQGNSNVAIGNEAMVHNTSGDENVSIGYAAGSNITTSHKNVAVGAYAIGYGNPYTGHSNTAVGYESLLSLSTGDDNTSVGRSAGYSIMEGDDNVSIGSWSLKDCLSGNGNIAIGYRAGRGISDGSNNIIIGNNKAENILPEDLSSTVIVSCGVTERLRINSAGLVGIGTTNPEYDLDFGVGVASTIRLVSGPLGTAIRIGAGSNGNQVTLLRVDGGNPNHKGTTNNSAYGFSVKYMGDRAGNRNSLSIFSDNQTGTRHEAITILQDGRIGLGTDDPAGTNDENHAPVLTILNDPSTAVSYGTSDAFVVKSKDIDGTGISTVFAIRPFMPNGPIGATGHNPMYNVALSGTWFHFDAAGQNFNFLADDAERTYVGFYTGTSADNLRAGEYTTLNGDGTPTAFGLANITYRQTEGLEFSRGGGASADISFKIKGKSSHGTDNKIVRFKGDSDALDLVNHASGDYSFYNTEQGNQVRIMDGTGGVELRYADDGTKTIECDSGGIISPYIFNTTSSNTSNYVRMATTGTKLQRVTSSRRYKNNIGIYTGGLSRISTITPRTWNDHKSGENIVGFIAEELHESGYTDAVTYTPWFGGSEVGIGEELSPMVGNGTTAVTKTGEQLDDEVEVVDGISENTIICDLVLAVQELTSRISALESN